MNLGPISSVGWRLRSKGRSRREPRDFPQICLRADRRSAYEQWDRPLDAALRGEYKSGIEAIRAGETASRFASGHGRCGSFEDL